MTERKALLDFLTKILVFDPSIRLTPKAALQHPFITSAMNNNATTLSISGDTFVQMQPTNTTRPLSSNSLSGLTNNSSSINTSRTEDSVKTPLNLQENLLQSTPCKPFLKTPSVSPITTIKTPQIIVSPPPLNVRTATVSPPTKALKSILKKPATDYQQFVPPQVPAQQENTLDSRLALFYPLPPRPNSIVPVTTIDQNTQYQLYNNTNLNSESLYRRATTSKSPNQLFQQYPPPTIVNNMGYYLDPQSLLTTSTSPLLYNTQYDVHRPNKQFGNMM